MLQELLFLLALSLLRVKSQCLDIEGKIIAEDYHYVPGPDACILCVCEKGQPSLCKAVLCAPPPDCQSFLRLGRSCCNFTCLDDTYHKHENNADEGFQLVISAAAALLTIFLILFVVHRFKQRKTAAGRQNRTLRGDRRPHGGLGYLTGGLGYLPENYYPGADGFDRHIEFHYEEAPSQMLWKPTSGGPYLPRGEAPPPYDEVMALARPELIITTSGTLPNISHRTIPLSITAPGMIRIIHPQQGHPCQEPGVVTLPLTPGKLQNSLRNTLHINISGCGFHPSQNLDGTQARTQQENLGVASGIENSSAVDSAQISGKVICSETTEEPKQGPGSSRESDDLISVVTAVEDDDDHRSECENCKSSPSAGLKYYSEENSDPPETMTLQRLPRETDDDENYCRSMTLPAHCKEPRRVLASRDGWFSSMPESSSEED